MVIEPKYLTFDEYIALGGDLEQSLFNVVEYRAEKQIDLHTFNRLKRTDIVPQEVKMCIFELIPIMNKQIDSNSDISSETIGNYSVTKKTGAEMLKETLNVIQMYLANVKIDNIPILYVGADEN